MTANLFTLLKWTGCCGLAFVSAGCGSSKDNSDGSGGSSANSAFVPAMEPADICALLGAVDIQTILTNPDSGSREGIANDIGWLRKCRWLGDGAAEVLLTIAGATDRDNFTSIVVPPSPALEGRQELNGLGDVAAYYASPDIERSGVQANWHSYAIDLSATGVPALAPADKFVPLVKKVISQLK
jgi:hypothetical protein